MAGPQNNSSETTTTTTQLLITSQSCVLFNLLLIMRFYVVHCFVLRFPSWIFWTSWPWRVRFDVSINYNGINQKQWRIDAVSHWPRHRHPRAQPRNPALESTCWTSKTEADKPTNRKPGDKFSIGRPPAFATKIPHKSDYKQPKKKYLYI